MRRPPLLGASATVANFCVVCCAVLGTQAFCLVTPAPCACGSWQASAKVNSGRAPAGDVHRAGDRSMASTRLSQACTSGQEPQPGELMWGKFDGIWWPIKARLRLVGLAPLRPTDAAPALPLGCLTPLARRVLRRTGHVRKGCQGAEDLEGLSRAGATRRTVPWPALVCARHHRSLIHSRTPHRFRCASRCWRCVRCDLLEPSCVLYYRACPSTSWVTVRSALVSWT